MMGSMPQAFLFVMPNTLPIRDNLTIISYAVQVVDVLLVRHHAVLREPFSEPWVSVFVAG